MHSICERPPQNTSRSQAQLPGFLGLRPSLCSELLNGRIDGLLNRGGKMLDDFFGNARQIVESSDSPLEALTVYRFARFALSSLRSPRITLSAPCSPSARTRRSAVVRRRARAASCASRDDRRPGARENCTSCRDSPSALSPFHLIRLKSRFTEWSAASPCRS
jgi:hypothetical protein